MTASRMFRCLLILVFALLASSSRVVAQPLPMAVNANPNAETMELSYRDEFRVRVGTTIPIARTDSLWVTLAGAAELHDPSASLFPSLYWRGLMRLSFDGFFGEFRLGAHYAHESDHETVASVGSVEYRTTPFLYLNALGVHGSRRWDFGQAFFDAGAVARFHAHTCTVRRELITVEDLCGEGALSKYLGFESQLRAALGRRFGEYVSLFGALHWELIVGGERVGTEVRVVARAGASFHTSHGDWTLYGEGLFGNEVGLFREQRGVSGGGGLRYTPPFAD